MSTDLQTLILFKAKNEVTPAAKEVEDSIIRTQSMTVEYTQALLNMNTLGSKAYYDLAQKSKMFSDQSDEGMRSLVHSGRIAGIGFRDLRHVMTGAIFGIETGLMSLGQTADKTTKKNIEMVQGLSHVALAAAFFGPVGALATAAGVGVGYLAGQIQEAKQAVEEIRKPFEETRHELEALARLKGIDAVAKQLGVTNEGLKEYVRSGTEAYNRTQTLNALQEQTAVTQAKISQATELLTRLRRHEANVIDLTQAAMAGLITETIDESKAAEQLDKVISDGTSDLKRFADATAFLTPATQNQAQAAEETARVTKIYTNGLIAANEEQESLKDQLDKTTRAYEKQKTAISREGTKLDTSLTADLLKLEKELDKAILKQKADLGRELQRIDREQTREHQREQIEYTRIEEQYALQRLRTQQELDRQRVNEEIANRNRINDFEQDEFFQLRNAKTDKERGDIILRHNMELGRITRDQAIRKQELEQQATIRKADEELQRKERQERFKEQMNLQEESARQQRDIAIETRNLEIETLRQAEKDHEQADKDRTKEQKAALQQRAEDERQSYLESTRDAEKAAAKKIHKLFDIRTETDKLRDSILNLSPAWDPAIQQAEKYEGIIKAISLGTGAANAGVALASIPNFDSGGTVPGAIGEPRIVLAHGGETITPPSAAQGPTFIFNAPIYGVNQLEQEIRRVQNLIDRGQ